MKGNNKMINLLKKMNTAAGPVVTRGSPSVLTFQGRCNYYYIITRRSYNCEVLGSDYQFRYLHKYR